MAKYLIDFALTANLGPDKTKFFKFVVLHWFEDKGVGMSTDENALKLHAVPPEWPTATEFFLDYFGKGLRFLYIITDHDVTLQLRLENPDAEQPPRIICFTNAEIPNLNGATVKNSNLLNMSYSPIICELEMKFTRLMLGLEMGDEDHQ